MKMSDWAFASALRDTILSIVREVLKRDRPEYTTAVVVQSDLASGKVQVRYRDGEDPVSLPTASATPLAPGTVVKIDGLPNDRHVVGAMNDYSVGEVPYTWLPYLQLDPNGTAQGAVGDLQGLSFPNSTTAQCIGHLIIPTWWKEWYPYVVWAATTSTGPTDIVVWEIETWAPSLEGIGNSFMSPASTTGYVAETGLGQGLLNKTRGQYPRYDRGILQVGINRDSANIFDLYTSTAILVGILAVRTA